MAGLCRRRSCFVTPRYRVSGREQSANPKGRKADRGNNRPARDNNNKRLPAAPAQEPQAADKDRDKDKLAEDRNTRRRRQSTTNPRDFGGHHGTTGLPSRDQSLARESVGCRGPAKNHHPHGFHRGDSSIRACRGRANPGSIRDRPSQTPERTRRRNTRIFVSWRIPSLAPAPSPSGLSGRRLWLSLRAATIKVMNSRRFQIIPNNGRKHHHHETAWQPSNNIECQLFLPVTQSYNTSL